MHRGHNGDDVRIAAICRAGLRKAGLADSELYLRPDAGQAMAEYALILSLIMIGLIFTGLEFIPKFFDALNAYYDSFYSYLNLPFP